MTIHLISVTLIKPPTLHISMTLQKLKELIQQVVFRETIAVHGGAKIQKCYTMSLATNSHRPKPKELFLWSHYVDLLYWSVLFIVCHANTDPSGIAGYHITSHHNIKSVHSSTSFHHHLPSSFIQSIVAQNSQAERSTASTYEIQLDLVKSWPERAALSETRT